MAKTQVLRYFIHLTDKDLVDTLNAEMDAGGGPTINPHGSILVASGISNGLYQAPSNVSTAVAPDLDPTATSPAPIIEQGDAMSSPSLTSEWFTTTFNFPRDVATFQRKSGGWFGIPLLFGTTTRFYWSGRFVYTPITGVDQEGAPVATPAPIPERYFCQSFELPTTNTSSGATGNGGSQSNIHTSRDASGYIDGYGMGFRAGTTLILSQTLYEHIPGGVGSAPQKVWERFYLTIRALPLVTQSLHASSGFPTASNGTGLSVLATGQIGVYIRTLAGTSLVATSAALVVGTRYRIDQLMNWNNAGGAGGGQHRVYLNGVQFYDSGLTSLGLGSAGVQRQQSSELGQGIAGISAGGDVNYEADVDFWMAAAIPNNGGTESLNSVDWINGSRTVVVEANGQAADFTGWTTGKYRSMANRINRGANELTSTTALAIASFDTNAVARVRGVRQALGVASIHVAVHGHRGTNSGEVGYKLNGGADVYAAKLQGAAGTPTWINTLYTGPATAAPLTLTGLEIKHRKGNDVVAGGITAMMATIELIGIFSEADVLPDADDVVADPGFSPIAGVHNSAYPESPWANTAEPAFSPYHIVSGTYVGNGTGQDLTVKAPPVFIAIRRVTGTGDTGGWFFTSMLGAHTDIEQGMNPFVRALIDPSYAGATAEDEAELRFLIRISSDNAQVNTNAQTYHYFAVCDPGARFHLATAVTHAQSGTFPRTDPLPVVGWTPTFVLEWAEDSSPTISERLYFKDSSVLSVDAMLLTAGVAELANAMTLGAGQVVRRAGLYTSGWYQNASIMFRPDDGNGPFTIPPFAVVSWLGDGTASRTLSVNLGGKRPLYAVIAGNAGAQRDPSHTTTNSSQLDNGTQAATFITGGGIDAVQVGSSLNASSQPYVMLVYPGSATAGNGGWSIDGEFWPIEPNSPVPSGGWVEPTIIEGGGGGGGGGNTEGENILDLEDSVVISDGSTLVNGQYGGQVCEFYSRRVANIALGRIGISKTISDIVTDTTEAATQVRRHYNEAVNAVLRDFPWAFATRYANLTLVAGAVGTPVNNDWTFSYQVPDACIMVRRIAVKGVGRSPVVPLDTSSANPSLGTYPTINAGPPVPFRLTADPDSTERMLLYTNLEGVTDDPVVAEYTIRIGCTSFFGDPLYRDALAWRLASALADSLSRDAKKSEWCMENYLRVLPKAKVVDANEQQQEGNADADWISGR